MPFEEAARVTRVLAEHDVGGREVGKHPQRRVLEIADRRRADREWHKEDSSSSKPTKAAPMSPAAVPSSALTSETALRIGSSGPPPGPSPAGPGRDPDAREP